MTGRGGGRLRGSFLFPSNGLPWTPVRYLTFTAPLPPKKNFPTPYTHLAVSSSSLHGVTGFLVSFGVAESLCFPVAVASSTACLLLFLHGFPSCIVGPFHTLHLTSQPSPSPHSACNTTSTTWERRSWFRSKMLCSGERCAVSDGRVVAVNDPVDK